MARFLAKPIINKNGGDEGGEILLEKADTNTTLSGTGVTIDVYQNKIRFFEQGGSARGAYIDLTAAGAGVGSNLLSGSGVTTLDGLTDVVVPTPQSGDFLKYNGSVWVNDPIDLGTDTVGSYVGTITAGTGVSTTGASTGEGIAHTISIGQSVATNANPTFAGATLDAVQVGITAAGEIDTTTGNLTLDSAGGTTTVDDNLIVTGNLTVSGTTTTLNTETFTVDDNIIVLNNNVTGAPSENAGIEIERGTSTNVLVRWNETNDKWELTNDGTTYGNIVTTADSGTVTSGMIADGAILDADINASAAIAHSKLANATAGQVLLGTTSTGVITATTVSGDISITGGGVTAISSGVIVNADVNTSAAIALSKLASGTSGQVVVANASGVPTYTTISGDITISNTGVATIAANSVVLGTDTTGNYMSDVSAGTGISVTHTPAEGSTATVAVDTTYSGFAPVGAMLPWAGGSTITATYTNSDVPSGWLLCDGQAVSRTIYSSLFSVIDIRYGQGDGSTTFNLPNLMSQLPIGSKTANAKTNNVRVTSVSVSTANATVDHTHNMNASSITNVAATADHTHNMNASTVNVASTDGTHSHYTSGNITIAQHDHSYYKPNSGVNGYNTGLSSANYSTGWNSTNAQGGNVVANSGASGHNHTATVSIGSPVTTSGNTTSHTHVNTLSVGTPVTTSGNTTLHQHTTTGQNVVWIIRY